MSSAGGRTFVLCVFLCRSHTDELEWTLAFARRILVLRSELLQYVLDHDGLQVRRLGVPEVIGCNLLLHDLRNGVAAGRS